MIVQVQKFLLYTATQSYDQGTETVRYETSLKNTLQRPAWFGVI